MPKPLRGAERDVTGPIGHIRVDVLRADPYDRSMTEIDARDLLCPLPVLRLRKALAAVQPGETLRLIATDPAALIDVPHFCAEQGHSFLGATPLDPTTTAYLVQK